MGKGIPVLLDENTLLFSGLSRNPALWEKMIYLPLAGKNP